jgi:ATP-dependent Clp protease, protease subunit
MNLMQLLINNRDAPRSLRIEQNGTEATVYLYDVIGADYYGGISAKELVPQLAALEVDVIHLRINSPGGDVFHARAIAAALTQHKAKKIGHIDGLAASAATYVGIACDELRMAEGSFFMVHNAWTLAMGNANDFEQTIKLLRKVDASISADYQRKTGATAEQVEQWMAETTWFSAEEAQAAGFIDAIDKPEEKPKNAWNLSAYGNAPKALTEPPKPEPENTITPEQLHATLRSRLRLLQKIAR